jgi:predicted ATP-dependent endonuclease of OLD family
MQLRSFRVLFYRPILDSGWVDIDDITVVVGKNESGKTALLKALHKFNPFKPDPYNIDREWPRGHRKERSQDQVVVETRFEFTDTEKAQVSEWCPGSIALTGVQISKTYKGDFKFAFLPTDLPAEPPVDWLESQARDAIGTPADAASDQLKQAINDVTTKAIQAIQEDGAPGLRKASDALKVQIDSAVQKDQQPDQAEATRVKTALQQVIQEADMAAVRKKLETEVRKWLPTFIYMDDHKPFQGLAHLDQIKQRKDQNQLTEQDKTFLTILEMAGLNFDQEFQRATIQDKEQRMLDMNDASLTLTKQLADHWTQRNYQVRFEADGHHVIAFVSDEIQPALVPLNERSKGFQWFFSFDVTFLYETRGTFKNAIILLDEPGLHLHAAAQRDLLKRIREYAKGNQLLYTTHMPFMIDMERLDNIRVCGESKEHGTKVSADFYAADEHARFPLQAALGLSISQSLFVGPFNLVVEGVTDFWLLSTMAAILRTEGRPSLDERIVITPSGGATKAAYVGTMLQGQQLNVIVLLDSDPEGQRVAEGLIKQWIMKDRHVLMLGQLLERTDETTIEDLFPATFYLQYVNRVYEKELGGKPLSDAEVSRNAHPQIVRRIDEALKARGVQPNSDGWAFNKGRPAKLLLAELPKTNASELPDELLRGFEGLFGRINEAMPGLQNKTPREASA